MTQVCLGASKSAGPIYLTSPANGADEIKRIPNVFFINTDGKWDI